MRIIELDIKVREYRPGDEKQIVDLLIEVFNGWPHFDLQCAPQDHWTWKYLDNPKKLNAIVVAEDGGRIVGCEHGYFLDIKIGNNTLLAHHGGDAAIDPEAQGEGIYSKINKFRRMLPQMMRCDYSYWATTNRKIIAHSRKENLPSFPRELLQVIKINDLDLHFSKNRAENRLIKKLGYTTLRNINKIKLTKRTHETGDHTIKTIDTFDDRIDAFWGSIHPHYKHIVVRNKEYLNWRYCDPRAGEYHIKQAEADGDVLGYCVYRVNKHDSEYPRGYIMDLITAPNRIDVTASLLTSALEHLDNLDVNIIYSWAVKGHPNMDILTGHGFVDSKSPLNLSHRWVNDKSNETELMASPPDQLHCQMGDVDWM